MSNISENGGEAKWGNAGGCRYQQAFSQVRSGTAMWCEIPEAHLSRRAPRGSGPYNCAAHVAETGHFLAIWNRPENVHNSNWTLQLIRRIEKQL